MSREEFESLNVGESVRVRRSGKIYQVLARHTSRADIWPPYRKVPCRPFLVFTREGTMRTYTLDAASLDKV